MEWLTYDRFAGRLGQRFEVETGDGQAEELELIEATEGTQSGGPGPDGQERLQFSLVFCGAVALPQGTHRLTHPDLGDLDLFLVPIGREGDLMKYEAAFA